MKNILTILFLVVFTASAQDKGDFTLELDVTQIHYSNMEVTNRFLRDTMNDISRFYAKILSSSKSVTIPFIKQE